MDQIQLIRLQEQDHGPRFAKRAQQRPAASNRNLLNGLGPDTRIFRYTGVDSFFDMIADRHLLLRKPHLWDDPSENILRKTRVRHNDRSIGFNLTNDFFGQCWTLSEECDGFWRNYCSLSAGVCFGTTAGKLIHAVWDETNRFRHLQCFVGKVRYLTDDELDGELQGCFQYGHWLTDPSGQGCAQALLWKRTAFAWEREVRVLASNSATNLDCDTHVIDPVEFIDCVVFAPKMDDAQCDSHTDRLISMGFAKSTISRSTLYDPRTLVVNDALGGALP